MRTKARIFKKDVQILMTTISKSHEINDYILLYFKTEIGNIVL